MDMDKPIIGTIINYRTMCFGFLASKEVLHANVSNLGLFDQRRGLKWIQENIQSFGGNPDKVSTLHKKLTCNNLYLGDNRGRERRWFKYRLSPNWLQRRQ